MKKKKLELRVAVIGSGPAGLMAADVISSNEISVTIFDQNKAPAKKLLIAGSSGLNVTNSEKLENFHLQYKGSENFFKNIFKVFSRNDWINYLHNLKIGTFVGTSRRYFIKGMKASKLVRTWLDKLKNQNVEFKKSYRLLDFENRYDKVVCKFEIENNKIYSETFDAVCLCIGGGSYVDTHKMQNFIDVLKNKKIQFEPFFASNVGFEVKWPGQIIDKIKFKPLKNITLTTSKGSLKGDLLITPYGLEGTPIYSIGKAEIVKIDLKPDLTEKEILKKCEQIKENLSPFRRLQKKSILTEPALTLVYHLTPKNFLQNLNELVRYIKNFEIELVRPRPIEEAISTGGGIKLSELDESLMLHKFPNVYVAGEIIDWDTTTGGFLIQGCISTGYYAGISIINNLTT